MALTAKPALERDFTQRLIRFYQERAGALDAGLRHVLVRGDANLRPEPARERAYVALRKGGEVFEGERLIEPFCDERVKPVDAAFRRSAVMPREVSRERNEERLGVQRSDAFATSYLAFERDHDLLRECVSCSEGWHELVTLRTRDRREEPGSERERDELPAFAHFPQPARFIA